MNRQIYENYIFLDSIYLILHFNRPQERLFPPRNDVGVGDSRNDVEEKIILNFELKKICPEGQIFLFRYANIFYNSLSFNRSAFSATIRWSMQS